MQPAGTQEPAASAPSSPPVIWSTPRVSTHRLHDVAALVRSRPDPFALAFVLTLAAAARAFHILREPFALNDGGMFYAMARDIQASNYALPDFSSYNDGSIPFVYSPLSLYLAALGDSLTPASLADMFRILPFIGSLFVVWAFTRLALTLLPDKGSAYAAAVAFALVPRSFIWLLMGGGLPRSFALGLAILAIREAYLLATAAEPSRRRILAVAVLCGLTALTHMETAAFLALTMLAVMAYRPRRAFDVLTAGAGAAIIAAPWLLLVLARHGFAPFIASFEFGGTAANGGIFDLEYTLFLIRNPVFTDEQFFPLIGALGVIGAFYAAARGLWYIPAWWAVILLTGMRASPTYAALPVALLAGYVVFDGLGTAIAARARKLTPREWRAVGTVAIVLIVFLMNGALQYARYDATFLRSLPGDDRAAFQWINEETPSNARFAVVPVASWYADYASEWFPALTERESVGTSQGYEWVPDAFDDRLLIHDQLWQCTLSDAGCLARAMTRAEATHLFIPSACCSDLSAAVQDSPRFNVLYARKGVVIAALRW